MELIDRSYARISLVPDDAHSIDDEARSRRFLGNVQHRAGHNQTEKQVATIELDVTLDEAVEFLNILGVNSISTGTHLTSRGLLDDAVPFAPEDFNFRLWSSGNPVNLFVLGISGRELEERLGRWDDLKQERERSLLVSV